MGGPFQPAPAPEGEELELGYISGVFGVNGEVRLHLHHRESTLLAGGQDVVLVDPSGARWSARLSSRAGAGRRVLGRFRQPLSREQAAELKGWTIHVPTRVLPELGEGEFWVWQIRGAPVRVDGARVGVVVDVHASGPVDVFELRLDGEKEHVFVPAVRERVVAAGPDGLDLRERP